MGISRVSFSFFSFLVGLNCLGDSLKVSLTFASSFSSVVFLDYFLGASLTGDCLRGCSFLADLLRGTSFRGDCLRGASFLGDCLRGASFLGDCLRGTSYLGDCLRGASFLGDCLRVISVFYSPVSFYLGADFLRFSPEAFCCFS